MSTPPASAHPPLEAAFISGLPTPPTTPTHTLARQRTRRRENLSDSSEEAERFNQVVVEDYRCGFPLSELPAVDAIPIPIPRHETDYLDSCGGRRYLQECVRKILDENGIKTLQKSFYKFPETFGIAKMYLIALATRPSAGDKKWIRAANSILNLFRHRKIDIYTLGFILEDPRGRVPRISRSISGKHPAALKWKEIEHKIIYEVLYPNVDWRTLALLIRGRKEGFSSDRFCPTVVLQVTPESYENWAVVAQRIEILLHKYEETRNVGVEVIRDIPVRFDAKPTLPTAISADQLWRKKTFCGASVGSTQIPSTSGSIAGILCLAFPDGSERIFALTNFHVAVPIPEAADQSGDLTTLDSDLKSAMRKGLTPTTAQNLAARFQVNMPSPSDFTAVQEYDAELVANALKHKLEHLFQWSLYEDDNTKHLVDSDLFPDIEKHSRNNADAARRVKQKPDAKLGAVYAASGLRRGKGGMLLDWALICIEKGRVPKENKIPDCNLEPNLPTSLIDYTLPQGSRLDLDLKIVFKYGRSSGMTKGSVNGVEEAELKGWREDDNGNIVYKVGYAQLVTAMTLGQARAFPRDKGLPRDRPYFGMPGDSGSAVFTEAGEFVGIYVRGNVSTYSDTNRFIDVETLTTDIKKITGATVVRVATPSDLVNVSP